MGECGVGQRQEREQGRGEEGRLLLCRLVAFGIVQRAAAASACAAAAAVAHAMLYIFAIYFTQHKFICGCNFNSLLHPAPPFPLPFPSCLPACLLVFVIVAAASLVNALHFVARSRRRCSQAMLRL